MCTCLCDRTILLAFVHLRDVVLEGRESVVGAQAQHALEALLVGVERGQVLLKDIQGRVELAADGAIQGHAATEVQAGGKQVLVKRRLVREAHACHTVTT